MIRTEPVLRRIAEERNPGNVLFGRTVTALHDDGEEVFVTVVDSNDIASHYRCDNVIGADGGKTVGPHIGAVMEGRTRLQDKVSVHFKADLSQYWDGKFHFWLSHIRLLISKCPQIVL